MAPRDKVDELTEYINTVDPTGNIKFTVEQEQDKKLPVSDVLITRHDDGLLDTSVYRKKTHMDQYLNFRSDNPLHHKLGVIRSLLDRKDTIITHETHKQDEDKHICEALMKNGYPRWSINLAKTQKQTQKKNTQKKTQEQANTRKKMVVIPYVKNVSEQVAKAYKKVGITSAMRPHKKIRNMVVHAKDEIPIDRKDGVVYQVPCKNCETVYIGETSKALGTRISEHKDDVRKKEKRQYTTASRKESQSEYNKSAITDHVNNLNHVPDWDNVKIIASEHNKQARWVKEAIAIKRHGNTMNRGEGNKHISNIYHSLVYQSSRVRPGQKPTCGVRPMTQHS